MSLVWSLAAAGATLYLLKENNSLDVSGKPSPGSDGAGRGWSGLADGTNKTNMFGLQRITPPAEKIGAFPNREMRIGAKLQKHLWINERSNRSKSSNFRLDDTKLYNQRERPNGQKLFMSRYTNTPCSYSNPYQRGQTITDGRFENWLEAPIPC